MRHWIRCIGRISGILPVLLVACDNDSGKTSTARTPEVGVFEVKQVSIATEREWIGMLEPLRSAVITAPELGEVIAVDVSEGQPVQKGDVLVRMDGPDLSARRSVLEERHASRVEELKRWQRLAEANAAGPAEVEAVRLQLLEVEEALASLHARIRSVQLQSPVRGRVSGLQVAPQSRVSAGDVLLRVRDEDAYGVRLQIPAGELPYVFEREFLALKDGEGNELPIRNVVQVDDPLTPRGFETIEVWVEGSPPSNYRDARLTYQRYRDAVLVPWTAVAREGDTHWVARIDGDPATVERRTVRLGSGKSRGVEVLEGLTPGDLVFRYEPRSQAEGTEVIPVRPER